MPSENALTVTTVFPSTDYVRVLTLDGGVLKSRRITRANFLAAIDAVTSTLTNKRITPRVTSEASSATPTINTDNTDYHRITALAAAITSFTTNLSGTPTAGQELSIEILDNGTARAITWGSSFVATTSGTLPITTTTNKILLVKFIWSVARSKWMCVAVTNEA